MKFLARDNEIGLLRQVAPGSGRSKLTVLYGRRRVGKTRLVEEAFKNARLLQFEGLEGGGTAAQQQHFLETLAQISGLQAHRAARSRNWKEILMLLSEYLGSEPSVVLLDEFQWMAAERTQLVSYLKYVWDNFFAKRNRVHLILCGSVGSFIVKKVIRSRALYGRTDLELQLAPLRLPEIKSVFMPQRSLREITELYMAMGGIPKYLELVDPSLSVRLNLERLCFSRAGYLANEFERIFTSHFGSNPTFRRIVTALASRRFASRNELLAACRVDSGGRISECLEDLRSAGFIDRYSPLDRSPDSKLVRYRIADPYLLFYFRFIAPAKRRMERAGTGLSFDRCVPERKYAAWAGLLFEFVCWLHADLIADRLGFSAVNYDCGPWFSRAMADPGAQIDLLFKRADHVFTICEMKFQDTPVGRRLIPAMARKVALLDNPRRWSVEKVLISASPPAEELLSEGYVNRVLTLDDLFG